MNKKKLLLLLLIPLLLAGCAGEKAHREGMTLLEGGNVENGLAKLEEATIEAPDNLRFRADLISKRQEYIDRMLLVADNERAIGRPDEAQVLYERVLNLDRDNPRAKAGLEAVDKDRRHTVLLTEAQELQKKGDLDGAQAKLRTILLEEPNDSEAKAMQRKIDEQRAREMDETPALQSRFKKPITLQFRDANLKMVFEALSRTSGINILLDRDVRPDLKTTIFVKDVSVEDTLDLILMQNQLEKKILSENTVFIYPNTPAKIKDYQDLKIRTFHFDNADAKNMMTMVKTVLKTKDLYLDEKTNSLVMRDTPDAIRLAEKLVAAQDTAEPEVLMEVEVLEVTRSRLTQLGVKWPDQVGLSVTGITDTVTPNTVTSGGAVVQGAPTLFTQPLTLESLRHGPNAASVTVTPLNWAINLQGQDSDVKLLASPRIRAKNKEKAKIMVGDRVPVITNSVTPTTTGTSVVSGNVTYLDVGLKLEVEPQVHPDGDVAIKVNLEVSSLTKEVTTASGTLAYQVGTRNASTLLRLKDGETQIMGGLINDADREAAQKVPGLGDLPILGELFGSNNHSKDKTEIILSITPHVIRNTPPMDATTEEFWSGTDSTLRDRPLSLRPVGQVSVSMGGAAAPAAPSTAAPARPTAPGAAAPHPVTLSLQVPPQAKVGDRFTVAVNALAGQPVTNFPVRIGFDPAALKVVDVTEGDFLRLSNVQGMFSKDVNASSGQISVNLATSGAVGGTGSGTLANVTFEVTAAKQAQITILGSTPSGPGGTPMATSLPPPYPIRLVPKQ